MKIQKTYKAGILALAMLFGLPASLMAAEGEWDRMLDALHHNKAAISHLSKQDQAVLEAAILLKAHRPELAMSILDDQPDNSLIKQLKVQATREHLVEVVRRAGGTRSEVKLPAPSEKLNKALAEVDAKLQSYVHQLAAEKTTPAMPISSPVRVAHKAGEDVGVNKDVHGMISGKTPSPAVHDAVLQAVEAWRASWSTRDLDAYFSAYADDFDVTDRFASMDAWKTYKRWVIGKRNSIQVTVELIKVHHVSEDQVRVEFLQHFRADSYQSDDLKVLIFRQSDGGWKIIREGSV